jgi:signal peptidase II
MRVLRALLVPLAVFVADRLLKIFALHTPHPQWGGLFQLHRNTGIAFSIPLPDMIMITGLAVAFIIVCGAVFREMKKPSPSLVPYFLILAGALSNILDRLQYGAVIDYFSVPLVGLFFNLADMMILGGILLLLFRQSGKMT